MQHSAEMNSNNDEEQRPQHGAAGLGNQRLDKWLFFARVVKSRTLAATLITEGKVRVNGERVDKPSSTVRIGDVVTTLLRQQVRVLRVAAFADRRSAAPIAATIFTDLSPPRESADPTAPSRNRVAKREPGSGRPTKRDRREIDRFNSDPD